jgi:hypothetical protein
LYIFYTKKNEGEEGKIGLFWECVPVGDGGHKERVNEGEYSRCILYSYMKIEEWNLL